MASPQFLNRTDLDECIGAARVDQLFDRDGDERADAAILDQILVKAEGKALSVLLTGFSLAQVQSMLGTAGARGPDENLRSNIAWIACELASEGKGEFITDDGRGRYWARYSEAMKEIEKQAKGQRDTPGGEKSAHVGGSIRPRLQTGEKPFVFAPSGNSRAPRGGF